MSRRSKSICSLVTTGTLLGSIALAAAHATPALAATSDPFQVLYIFPGVRDTADAAGSGVATAIHCFSFSPNTETIQYVVRDNGGVLRANVSTNVISFQTTTGSTHGTNLYSENVFLSPGQVLVQGTIGIAATSTNIVCTAHVLDASALVPNGIDLHGTRFNPISGTQE